MPDELRRLREKLCRELAQSELDAVLQTRREARRLSAYAPHASGRGRMRGGAEGAAKVSDKLRAIAAHAEHLRPRMDALMVPAQPVGIRVGRLVGEVFSGLRHFFLDRMLSAERSYRATLLGVRHGIDVAWLLRDVARRGEHVRLFRFCDDLVAEREVLLREAECALVWFAENPQIALTSKARIALAAASSPTPSHS